MVGGRHACAFSLAALCAVGCGDSGSGGDDDDDVATDGGGGGPGAQVAMSLAVVEGGASPRALGQPSVAAAFGNVSAVGTGLASLELFFTRIEMCEDVVLNGTAITSTSGCVTLYQGPDGSALEGDLAAAIAAAAAATEGYVDVMDPAARAALGTTVTLGEDAARDYAFGVVSWARPIRVRATLTDPADGTTPVLHTHPGAATSCSVNQNPYDCVLAGTALDTGPAETAIFAGGQGTIFKFQRPLSITAEDVAAEASFALELAFNPNGLVQGVTTPGATNFPPLVDGVFDGVPDPGQNVGNSIALVGAQLAAVSHPAGDVVVRERYAATLPGAAGGSFELRVELYSLEGDADRTIYGVNLATVPTADTLGYLVGGPIIFGVTTNEDDSVDLLDYLDDAVLVGLPRAAAVGDEVTAELACDPVVFACDLGTTVEATFTLEELAPL